MPEIDLDQYGAVINCECNACGSRRPANLTTLATCGVCEGLYGEGVECYCRPCSVCATIFNAVAIVMCAACLETHPPCSYCGGVVEELQGCRCGAAGLCPGCMRRHRNCANPVRINSYGYKPPAKFTGDGPLYLGVELEVDRGQAEEGSRRRAVEWEENPGGVLDGLGELSQDNTLFYFKSDGSLVNGFEIVTHPCSLPYHKEEFPWQGVLDAVKAMGLQSHNTRTCGLHVHASRLGFGRTAKQQEIVLGRLIMLWHRHWWRYAQMSRRRTKELAQWCLPNREAADVAEEDMVTMLETVKKPGDRSVAINTWPWDQGDRKKETVEFRLFKGTLNYSSLMAALEIVHHSITLAKDWKFEKVVESKWGEVVGDAQERGYNYLTEYVKERGVE